MEWSRSPAGRFLVLGSLAIALGVGSGILSMASWFSIQTALPSFSSKVTDSLVLRFFLGDSLAVTLILLGFYQLYRVFSRARDIQGDTGSLRDIISQALASTKDRKVGVASAIIYGIVYSFASGFVVYQPGVDFARTYGITSAGWATIGCCGVLGTVPRIVFFVPSIQAGFQVIPLNSLFLATIPLLVGFNLTMVSYAVRNGTGVRGGKWMSALGTSVALLTACPTCAGLFLASTVGGLGATALAVALAPYQIAFIAISLPVLVLSPLLTVASFRRSLKASCALPQPRATNGSEKDDKK